jgi:hypothetical protein
LARDILGWVAAAAVLVILNDPASAIQLKMAAGQQQITENFPGALHPGFRS